MLNLIENILELLNHSTGCDGSSLLYFDGFELKPILNHGADSLSHQTLQSVNEFIQILENEDVKDIIQSSLNNELINSEFKIQFIHFVDNEVGKNSFYVVLGFAKSQKQIGLNEYLKNFIESFLKSLGKILINVNTEKSIQSSLKLLEIGSWKEFFSELNEISGDMVFILDSEGCFLSVNKSGTELLDFTLDEIRGKHITDFIDPEHLTYANEEFSKIIRTKGEGQYELTFISRYEKQIIVDLNVRAIVSDDRILGLLGVGKNVSQLRQLQSKVRDLEPRLTEAERLIWLERSRSNQHKALLSELNRLKSEFVSNISHELRTPLASIVGFSETIASDSEMPSELKAEFNSIILNEGKRLAKLINDVLDLSKMETGKLSINKIEFDIIKLGNQIFEEYSQIAKSKDLILTKEIPEAEIIIEADKERITKSIQSVLDNSIQYTEPGGRIKIIISNLYREVEIIISDTGIGIPVKDLPLIHQKFHKVNRGNSEANGAGMGLVFVKQIVDLHKGLLNIQSEENKGTTVIIKLLKSIKARTTKS